MTSVRRSQFSPHSNAGGACRSLRRGALLGSLFHFWRCPAAARVPLTYHFRRGVASTDAEGETQRERHRADGCHEERVHELAGDAYLIDSNHDCERPDRDARNVRQQIGVAEVGLRSCAADETGQRIGCKPADDEDDDCHGKIWQPQEELPKDVGDGRQAQGIKGHHKGDKADEPFGDISDEAGRIGMDSRIAHEPGKARALRHVLEAYAAQ
jgi:hypothetical protein